MSADRRRSRMLGGLAVVSAALWLAALAVIVFGSPVARSGTRSPIQSQVDYIGSVREVSAEYAPLTLHVMRYRATGGPVSIQWYDSDFETEKPQTSAVVSMYVDGVAVASTVKASQFGTWEDGPGALVWDGELTPGEHSIAVRLASAPDNWGLPYVDPGLTGADELIVEPGGRSGS